MVVLTFAMTVHETQGQTLRRIILLLGRLPGMNVGRITWSLVYVALSRTKKLAHMKLFPTGSTKYFHAMHFAHLLKLSMPANLKKWFRSYIDHRWDRNVLRNEHLQSVRKVEKRLELIGEDKTRRLMWTELLALVKQLGFKATTRNRKIELFCKLKEHMVKRLLWKASKVKPAKKKGDRHRKRKAHVIEAENSQEYKSSSRPSKRLRGSKQSKHDDGLVRSTSYRNISSYKRNSSFSELTIPTARRSDDMVRVTRQNNKWTSKKHHKSIQKISMPQPIHAEHPIFKGLDNLGQTCYFNCIVQCLFHCPLFRDAIENVPPSARTIPILRELQRLFTRMARPTSSTHLSPSRCFSAAMKIPECERAGMNKNRQEDARGFFLMLVEHFRKKLKQLSELFKGELLSTVSCQRCSYSRAMNVPFKFLAISLPADSNEQYSYDIQRTHDIEGLLDDFVRPEFITYRCDHCGVQGIAEKKLDILRTPQILVLGLKRFDSLQKINDFVAFPSELGLKYASAGNEEHQRYQITGVVVHEGPSINAGHYLSYVYSEGIWLETNDSSVREVSWDTVKNMEVYLLFYLRL